MTTINCKPSSRRRPLFRYLPILLAFSACESAEQHSRFSFAASGRLEDSSIREASGLARSQRQSNLLWIINDNGAKARVHAVDPSGARIGEFDLKKSKNKDWEDLASFRLDNTAYLMIADIGDNDAKHDHRTLYFVEEPAPEKGAKSLLNWRIDFRYPDGARDAESAAIDVENQRALILSKRDLPPVLYAVPLHNESDEILTAEKLGPVTSLPRPTRQELEFAPAHKDWFWQTVGMDISQDNLAAVILTYRAVFYYQRQHGQSWLDALNTQPRKIGLGNFPNAEAIAFADNDRTLVVTGENKHSFVLQVDLNGIELE